MTFDSVAKWLLNVIFFTSFFCIFIWLGIGAVPAFIYVFGVYAGIDILYSRSKNK